MLQRARDRLGGKGRRTILFLDEIHRFNKAQQDALLPAVEEGLVTLIGATTENPYFEVNSALLSRMQLYELEPLGPEESRRSSGAAPPSSARERAATELVALIAQRAGGDARAALNILELAVADALGPRESRVGERHVEDAARKRPLVYDKAGDAHYDFMSAFIKSMRGSRPDAALYYLAAMLEAGEDPRFLARRMVDASPRRTSATPTRARCSSPSRRRTRSSTSASPRRDSISRRPPIYLARAPKSNAVITRARRGRRGTSASTERCARRRRSATRTIPARSSSAAARDTSIRTTTRADSRSTTSPTSLKGRTYYRPSGAGEETDPA